MKPKGDINSVIAEIERQMANRETINFIVTTKAYRVKRSTLSRRVYSVTRSHEEYISKQCRHLTNA